MSAQFETPENIVITYRPAGFGSRFIAWLLDQLFLLTGFALVAGAVIILSLSRLSAWEMEAWRYHDRHGFAAWGIALLIAFVVLIATNAFAFLVMELVGGGRTPGKRIMQLRVVKNSGFTLDATALTLRNLARLIDFALLVPPIMLPTLLVVLVTRHRQRLGDLLAGTLVVSDALPGGREFLQLREKLEKREPAEIFYKFNFRFANPTSSHILPREWITAVEKTLARWESQSPEQQILLRERVVLPLTEKCAVAAPPTGDESRFLADFLTTIYQREYRRLG